MAGQVTTTTLDIFCTLAREVGFFGAQDGRRRGGPASSVEAVESHGAAGQDAVLSSRRGAFKAFAHHVGRAREEPVRVRIVRRPHDLVGADEVREYSEAGFDRLER